MHKIAIKNPIFFLGEDPQTPIDRLTVISPLHLYTSCAGLGGGGVRPREMSKLVSYSVEMVSYSSYLRKTLIKFNLRQKLRMLALILVLKEGLISK